MYVLYGSNFRGSVQQLLYAALNCDTARFYHLSEGGGEGTSNNTSGQCRGVQETSVSKLLSWREMFHSTSSHLQFIGTGELNSCETRTLNESDQEAGNPLLLFFFPGVTISLHLPPSYHKFLRSKDLSVVTSEDLDCVLGRKRRSQCSLPEVSTFTERVRM